MFRKKSVFVFVLSLGLFVFSADGHAQTIKDKFAKPMPEIEMTTIADFKSKSKEVELDSKRAPELGFYIRVPDGWTETTKSGIESDIGQKVLSELKSFYGPANLYAPRSRITVEAVELDYDFTAERWFIQYLLANGYNINGLDSSDPMKADALYVYIKDSVSYAARARAIVNGTKVLFAQYHIPIERYQEEKVNMAHVINSFDIKRHVEDTVEDMEKYQFLDIAEFDYPTSWKLRSLPIRSIDRMKVELFNIREIDSGWYGEKEQRLDGQIDVNLVSIFASDTLEDEFENFKGEIEGKGLSMGEVLEERDDFLFTDDFDFVDTKVYSVTGQQGNMVEHELWVTIMLAEEYYYFVTLFTPSRDHDYFLWARNVESYKLVTRNLKPQKDILSSGAVDTSAIGSGGSDEDDQEE
ncbi:MAG: hypothetical protein JKY71_00010 [Alphaproteobacteria bacterium]|nr:hypothetical protein [Alphaproteobacteria bacterium]